MSQYAFLPERRFPCAEGSYSSSEPQWTHTHYSTVPSDPAPPPHYSPHFFPSGSSSSSQWPTADDAADQRHYRLVHPPAEPEPYSPPADFPESSQRTVLRPATDAPQIYSQAPPSELHDDSASHSPEYATASWTEGLYTLEGSPSPSHEELPEQPDHRSADDAGTGTGVAVTAPPAVKVEPSDMSMGCFIIEGPAALSQSESFLRSQTLAPPSEVRPRVSHAPDEMKQMMSIIRLNPFAIHDGEGRSVVPPTWFGGEARPLEEEPLIFEFQLDVLDPAAAGVTVAVPEIPIDNVYGLECKQMSPPLPPLPPPPPSSLIMSQEQPLHAIGSAFSPEYDPPEAQEDADRSSDWGSEHYRSDTAAMQVDPEPSVWELQYPQSTLGERTFASPHSTSMTLVPRHPSRGYGHVSHPYTRKIVDHYRPPQTQHGYDYVSVSERLSSTSLAVHRGARRLRVRPLEDSGVGVWDPRDGYGSTSRSPTYVTDHGSPACDVMALPSINSSSRRWSLPDSSSHTSFFS